MGSVKCFDTESKKQTITEGVCRSAEAGQISDHRCTGLSVCTGHLWRDPVTELTKQMESERVEGLYFAGEIVDVDGMCGGYNLQWAWSGGAVAGTAAAENLSEEKEQMLNKKCYAIGFNKSVKQRKKLL